MLPIIDHRELEGEEITARIAELQRALPHLTDRLNAQAEMIGDLQARLGECERKVAALENPPVTLQARRANGEMEGLAPGWPFWLPASDRHADYQGLAGDDCPRCGHHGLSPRYWHRAEPRAIASFAECPACRHSEPF